MILKTIACEGKVLEPGVLMDEIDVVDLESGIKSLELSILYAENVMLYIFKTMKIKRHCLMIPQIKCLRKLH